MDVDAVDAVLFGTPTALRKTSAQWQLTAAHEMFHVFQHAKGGTEKIRLLKLGPDDNAAWQLSFPFPYADSDVMRPIHLQGYLSYLGVSY